MCKKNRVEIANDLAKHCPDLVDNACGEMSCIACLSQALEALGYEKQGKFKRWLKRVFARKHRAKLECPECKATILTSWGLTEENSIKNCPLCGAELTEVKK